MDLVDEEDITVLELGEDGREVARSFEGRAGRDVELHPHLGGDDAGERGLAQPRRACEEQVVDRLAATPGGLEDDREVLLEFALADEFVEGTWAEARLDVDLAVVLGCGIEKLLTHAAPPGT